jgi:hypothetical protein
MSTKCLWKLNVVFAYIGKFAKHCPYSGSIAIELNTFNTIYKKKTQLATFNVH